MFARELFASETYLNSNGIKERQVLLLSPRKRSSRGVSPRHSGQSRTKDSGYLWVTREMHWAACHISSRMCWKGSDL